MSRDPVRLPASVRSARLFEQPTGDPAQAILALVRERALAEGARQGRAAARDEAVRALEAAVQRVEATNAEASDALARTSVELAVEIARRLLRREISGGNYDLEGIVREALMEASAGRGPCVIHLNPADCEALADARFRTGTRIQPDEGVRCGDVHVETSLGLLVRETSGALESIEKRLLEELH